MRHGVTLGAVCGLFLLALAGCKSEQAPSGGGDPFVDQPALETVGQDVEGRPMKLSNYRGKVVVLSFWGSWCPPCMSLVPHERDLVAKYKDKPFVLVGVNSDDETQAKLTIEREKMSWPMFWDGGSSSGPIATDWRVEAWPTMYVIDPEGIVRHRIVGAMPEELDKAIETELGKLPKS